MTACGKLVRYRDQSGPHLLNISLQLLTQSGPGPFVLSRYGAVSICWCPFCRRERYFTLSQTKVITLILPSAGNG